LEISYLLSPISYLSTPVGKNEKKSREKEEKEKKRRR
jgi:hypothetical protein